MKKDLYIKYSTSNELSLLTIYYDNKTTLENLSDNIITTYLSYYKNNTSKVAKLLGISRQTIYNRKLK
jgi:transcriptional regulator with PAS, ATPase and Fis domain